MTDVATTAPPLSTDGGPAAGLRPPILTIETVVTRWVTLDRGHVEELLSQIVARRPGRISLAGRGDLVLTTDVASTPRTRTLHGRLRYGRVWRVRDRVEIDVTMWSADTAELAVRPLRRHRYLAWAPEGSGGTSTSRIKPPTGSSNCSDPRRLRPRAARRACP